MSKEFALQMQGISKSFPGVKALSGVDLSIRKGQVHAIVGENGAGKSTLIKILGAVHQPDKGRIFIDGKELEIKSPLESISNGIAIIHQELNLVPEMSVCENMFLGREKTKGVFLNKRAEKAEVRSFFETLGIDIDIDSPCSSLSVGLQQLVEIARALSLGSKIIVMDEPTAALSEREVEFLFGVIKDLKARNVAIIYISHRLDEIFELADEITVLRDGNMVGSRKRSEFTREQLVALMVGRSMDQEFPKVGVRDRGEVCLELKNVSRPPAVNDVSFRLRKGDILGITGLVGAGRTELARLIYGADKLSHGDILINGHPCSINSPIDAIKNGICLLTEDRKHHGLILGLSSRENFGIANLDDWKSKGFVSKSKESDSFKKYIEDLDIRLSGLEQKAKNLSGGNQQKVLIARWLQSNADIIIFDEPTRGIDVGAKYEIYQLIIRLAAEGKAIIIISSELPEVLALCDPIIVMREGSIVKQMDNHPELNQKDLLDLAMHPSSRAALEETN